MESIRCELSSRFPNGGAKILEAEDLARASKLIYENTFDLIVIDLMLPIRSGGEPVDVAEEILGTIRDSENNRVAHTIAFTGFDDLIDEKLRLFAQDGVSLVLYEDGKSQWKQSLGLEVERAKSRLSTDFLIICALEKERQGYHRADCTLGDPYNVNGLDCVPMRIGELDGICLKINRMGLVEAAVAAARSIEHFSPKLVAMSGICAGFPEETKLGSLIVTDICWEYQTGKWTDEGFKAEAYSVGISPAVRSEISTIIASDPNGKAFKGDMMNDLITDGNIALLPTTSGSAVVSSEEALKRIGEQHRKVAGLDMEIYSVLQAASTSIQKPLFFAAKTVVDLGDSKKNDHLHTPGSILSARFVVEVIKRVLCV